MKKSLLVHYVLVILLGPIGAFYADFWIGFCLTLLSIVFFMSCGNEGHGVLVAFNFLIIGLSCVLGHYAIKARNDES